MKNIKNQISKTIYWILLLFVILVAIVPTISTFNIPLPFRIYAVQTGSMHPTIKTGDLIFIQKQEVYKEGDIITFNSDVGDKTPITHRITQELEGNTFKTKGDANKAQDIDVVREENILGKYIFRLPLLGYPINLVKTPLGFLILIVIPAVIISYEEFKKIKNEISSKKSKKQN